MLAATRRPFMPFAAPLPLWAYPLLFATGFSAGLVDSIAGGGGIISVPVLLNFGLPPQLALGMTRTRPLTGQWRALIQRSNSWDSPEKLG